MVNYFRSLWRPRRRLSIASVLVTSGALVLTGCGGDQSSSGSAKTITIAFVSQGTSNSWAAQLDAVAKKTAKENGVKLVYYNGEGDATKQLPEIQAAIAAKPDAMVLVPLGQAADTGPVERAMGQGIKVILCDSTVNTDKYTSLVNPDAATSSAPLAQWLADKINHQGTLLYIGGLPGNATTIAYDKGFNQVMQQYPNIKVVNAGNASYSISTAKQLTQTAIASGKTFDAAWGVGGESVTGIMQAYIDSKVRPIPPMAGASATNGILRLAIENNILVAANQFPPSDSKVCVETAIKAAKGQQVPKYINISELPDYANIYPPLEKYYQPKYSDDLYVGTDKVLTFDELKAINLTK